MIAEVRAAQRCADATVRGATVRGRNGARTQRCAAQRCTGATVRGRNGGQTQRCEMRGPRRRGRREPGRRSSFGQPIGSVRYYSSTDPEAEKSKSKCVRAAAGSKEYTGSGDAKTSEEILKQLADLKGLVSSYRRYLDKQQQEIEVLKRNYQPPYQGSWNLPSEPRSAGSAWPGASNSFPELAPVPREPAGPGRGPVRNGG